MTKKPAAEKAVSAVKAPRAVRPSATRTTSVRHKKSAVSPEPVVAAPAESAVQIPQENAQEAIAKIAYGYWEARGYQGGDAIEDWCRAEAEYASRNAAL
jgi:hypothetical protein